MRREVGGGFRMGNTCTPLADSCQCMAKLIQCCKVISLQLKEKEKKKITNFTVYSFYKEYSKEKSNFFCK